MSDYPGSIKSFDQQVDNVDDAEAVDVNEIYDEVTAIETELGTDVAGAHTDVKSRLAQSLFEAATMNTETLAGNKTLTDADGAIQNLDPGGSNRDVELPAEANTNSMFMIKNAADGVEDLVIKSDAPATIVTLRRGQSAFLFSDGTTWRFIKINGSVGKQTLYASAPSMYPQSTNGCSALTQIELTADQPELKVFIFDGSTAEYCQFTFGFPKKWNKGTVFFRVRWTGTAPDADGVAWTLQGVAVGDGDPIDVPFGSVVAVVDNAQGTSRDFYISDLSTAVTIAGSPGDDEQCFFRFGRDPSNGSDNMAEDAEFWAVDLFYFLEAESDD